VTFSLITRDYAASFLSVKDSGEPPHFYALTLVGAFCLRVCRNSRFYCGAVRQS
jgi:hypothetical protein